MGSQRKASKQQKIPFLLVGQNNPRITCILPSLELIFSEPCSCSQFVVSVGEEGKDIVTHSVV